MTTTGRMPTTTLARSPRAARGVFLAAAFCLVATRLSAQDAHYWAYQYGPVGQLVEGALVGGAPDLSAVYYNPGALVLIDDPTFVLGLRSFEATRLEIPDAAGGGLDVEQNLYHRLPQIVAGRIGPASGTAHRFAFSFLSRYEHDFDLGTSASDISATTPSGSIGFARYRQRLFEYWVGGTWSHRLSEQLAVGVSPFFAYRAQRQRRAGARAERDDETSRAAFLASELEYEHVRLLARAGLAWRRGPWQLGVALTTPGAGLWGRGKMLFNTSLVDSAGEPLLSASTQRDLGVRFRSSWSAAGGVTWRGSRTAVHGTVEWFSRVARHDVIRPAPAPVAGREETIPVVLEREARSVVNYAVGLEQSVGSGVTLYAGMARDHSSHVPARDTLAAWDITEASVGLSFRAWGSRLALGASRGWGDGLLPRLLTPPGEESSEVGARFRRWTFSLGLAVGGAWP